MRQQSVWLRKGKERSPYLLDGFLAALGGVTLVAFLSTGPSARFPNDADLLGVLLVVATWVPVAFRRRSPMAAFLVSGAAALAGNLLGYPDTMVSTAALITLYTVASRCDRRTSLTAATIGFACACMALVPIDDLTPGAVLSNVVVVGGVVALGDRKQVREAYLEQLELRAAEKERERIEAAQRAVGEERARIARELHDVVAHAMSVVAVQSGVGAHVIDGDPGAAKRLLETISDTSRDALAEMRRMLGVLRDGDGGDGWLDLAPAPGLAGLDELVDRFVDAGLPVALTVSGDRSSLAPGIDLAAYRIVQESLTNVLKHAGPARASVEVHCGREEVRLVVADDGRGPRPDGRASGGPAGHGLVGMRERAELYGGQLAVGPRPGGGFLVVAVLRPATTATTAAA